jgi:hypothetical protein
VGKGRGNGERVIPRKTMLGKVLPRRISRIPEMIMSMPPKK